MVLLTPAGTVNLPVSGAAVGWSESMTDKTCGALGCRNDATVQLKIDGRGTVVVCDDHADDHPDGEVTHRYD